MQFGRIRRWGVVLAVNVVVTATLLGAVEGTVRLMHPEIGPVGSDRRLLQEGRFGPSPGLRPGAEGRSGGAPFRVDARGFWAYAAADTTRPGWLFLGDSVTMGSGVAPDSTFAGRVAAGQDALDVWNPSLIGYSSADYLRVLDTLISRKRLRRVSVLWCLNDVYAGLPIPAGPQGSRVLQSRWMGFVREHVFTYQWLKATLLDRQRAYYLHDRAYYLETDRHLRTAMEHLRRMADLTWARGLLFEVVLIPYEYQLRTGDAGPQRLLARLLRAQGVAVRDAWPDFARAGASRRLYLYGDGIHLSALGHRVMADVLLRQPTSQEAG